MITFSEGFEGGTLGGKVSRDNTSFWLVDYEDQYPDDNLVRFTSDAYAGGLAATIPPDVLIAERTSGGRDEVYSELTWLGGDGGPTVTDMPFEVEWYYKFEQGMERYFGRFIFDSTFDAIGNTILDAGGHPDSPYQTSLLVGLEHGNDNVGGPGVMTYQHYNLVDAYPGHELGGAGVDTITPQFPRSTWLKCNFTWEGAGAPFTTKVVRANDGEVLMDLTRTAPLGVGLASWKFRPGCSRLDPAIYGSNAAGYDFQNWYDAAGATLQILGQVGGTRRRFVF